MLYLGYPEYIIQPGAIKTIFFQSFALNLAGDLANLLAVTYVIVSFVYIATLFLRNSFVRKESSDSISIYNRRNLVIIFISK